MKVVLFCGGLGMRLRDHAENVPKPMVPIGYRPILWHLMKYYAHWGHKDFILCLGYGGDVIKHYFLNYEESVSNDFILSEGGRKRELLSSDIEDWRITFVETGLNATIGERLMAVQPHVAGEEMFLANYADGLTNLPLQQQIEHFCRHDATASFLCVRPNISYHFVATTDGGVVTKFQDLAESGLYVNGGFFVFRRDIFNYLRAGDELVVQGFERLLAEQRLLAYRFDGFWIAMDTAKDKARIDEMHLRGHPPWEVWSNGRRPVATR
jgi:glucose-1-phosphate cytidylyltransferase